MKTDKPQLGFKKQANPAGILNAGKVIARDNRDYAFNAGRSFQQFDAAVGAA